MGSLERVRTGPLRNRQCCGRLVIQQTSECVRAGTQFDAAQIADARDLAILGSAHNDVAEFFLRRETALRVYEQLKRCAPRICRRSAKHARRDLHVLLANGLNYVRRRQVVRSQFVWVEPHAHAEIACAEDLYVADTREAAQLVLHLENSQIRQVQHVVTVVRRLQVHDHQQIRRGFFRGYTEALDFLRQSRQRLRYTVLHLHLRFVEVRAQSEGNRQSHHAVGCGLRKHVEHAFDAIDLLFEGRGHGVRDDSGICARVACAYDDGGRYDFRILAQGKAEIGERADDKNDNGNYRGKDGTFDEEIRNVHDGPGLFPRLRLARLLFLTQKSGLRGWLTP